MKTIVYSPNGNEVDGVVGHYRNPDFFEAPDAQAKNVILVGEYPAIKQAYADIGINVEQYQAQKGSGIVDGESKSKATKTKTQE